MDHGKKAEEFITRTRKKTEDTTMDPAGIDRTAEATMSLSMVHAVPG
jgi:hypothetical protein